jgi:hypothetical protein
MYTGRLVFSQLMDFLPMHQFRRCVDRYQGNFRIRSFSCLDQLLSMAFAQLSYRESLRDIESCLRAMQNKLYHIGIRGRVSKSTLAYANENRDWRIYADFAQVLINIARPLYADDDFGVELEETVYALDASTIDLCLSLFPWARVRNTKGAIKLHTLLDLRGNIPSFISITDGKVHDVKVLDQLVPEPGSVYIMDRGYLDFRRLYLLNQCLAFFIIRSKTNTKFKRLYSHKIDRATGLRCDQLIVLTGTKTKTQYPEKLRRVKFFDEEKGRSFSFLSNNFIVPALIIAELYKCRWQVGVSREGHIIQSVKVRPGTKGSIPVAWEAPWRESKMVEPSDRLFRKEMMQGFRPQRAVNADVASLHAIPVAETVYNARRQQGSIEKSPRRRLSPAGYQRWHVAKDYVSTGEALGARRRNLAEEVVPITLSGKWESRHQGGGLGCSTVDRCAAKRTGREGPRPMIVPSERGEAGAR